MATWQAGRDPGATALRPKAVAPPARACQARGDLAGWQAAAGAGGAGLPAPAPPPRYPSRWPAGQRAGQQITVTWHESGRAASPRPRLQLLTDPGEGGLTLERSEFGRPV